MEQDVKAELNERKETLNNMLAEFNKLKGEERWAEAWSQLIATLNYANETLKYSAGLLKNISQRMPQITPEQQEKISTLADKTPTTTTPKMIVIPKKQTVN